MSSIEALQMQLNEIGEKLNKLLFEVMKNSSMLVTLADAARILDLSYSGAYKRLIMEANFEPEKEIFFRRGKWYVSYEAISKLKSKLW